MKVKSSEITIKRNETKVKQDATDPSVQPSEAPESYLEEVRSQLVEIKIKNLKNNLSRKEHGALTELKQNTDINLNKKGAGEALY